MVEMPGFIFYGILEVIIVLLFVILYQWRQIRKYKPFFMANKKPTIFIRKYLEKALKYTRDYANTLKPLADQGKRSAIEHRQNLVARLNWIVLERDFLIDETPDKPYWDDMNNRISRLLDQWDLVGFTKGRPDADAITRALTDEDKAVISAENDFLPDLPEDGKSLTDHNGIPKDIDPAAKARIKFLERQVHQLDSYQKMFFGLQETYNGLKKHYRKMKNQIFDLKIDSEHAEELKVIIQQHEMHEKEMEDKISQAEQSRTRMTDEIHQMEEVYNLQIQQLEEKLEHNAGTSRIDQDADDAYSNIQSADSLSSFTDENAELAETANLLKKAIAKEDGYRISDIMDEQTVRIRELIASIHELDVDIDSKMALEERIELIEKANLEMVTAMQVIGMEAQRLHEEQINSKIDS